MINARLQVTHFRLGHLGTGRNLSGFHFGLHSISLCVGVRRLTLELLYDLSSLSSICNSRCLVQMGCRKADLTFRIPTLYQGQGFSKINWNGDTSRATECDYRWKRGASRSSFLKHRRATNHARIRKYAYHHAPWNFPPRPDHTEVHNARYTPQQEVSNVSDSSRYHKSHARRKGHHPESTLPCRY